ncbi:MAG: CRTAC1 family protein [Pirellulaceae bacterium]|nr:CRTAC1 family protein [Pirellulaceae bacterium]
MIRALTVRKRLAAVCTLLGWFGCLAAGGCFSGQSGREHQAEETGHQRMVRMLAEQKSASLLRSSLFGDEPLRENEWGLENLPLSVSEKFQAHYAAGLAAKRLGLSEKAVEHLRAAHELSGRLPPQILSSAPGIRQQVLLHLSGACLRMGETANCVHCQTSESCIFPIRGEGVHQQKSGSQLAVGYLEEYLRNDPQHPTARWLLNIAHMTLGSYPEGVPPEYRIPEERFASEVEFPRFTNVAREVGLATESLSGGVIVDDFDGDHWLDVLVSDWGDAGQLRYFRNTGQGQFQDQTAEAGLEGLFGGLNLVQADYDNDGDVDALVLRGAWRGGEGIPLNSLLRNDGLGHFEDVTFAAGLGDAALPSSTAAWADFDNDGDLDLYVGNEQVPCQLFENDGQGRFRDVAQRAGVENRRFTKGVVWGDFDADGYPDLYVSNYGTPQGNSAADDGAGAFTSGGGEPNRLYRNNRDGTFTDVAEQLGVSRPLVSFPAWFWDFNNDGALDLFVATFDGTVHQVAQEFLGIASGAERPCLYEGDGRGGFREVAAERKLDRMSLTMGANFGDLNNDGFLDVYLGTGHPPFEALMPNLMLLSQGGQTFADVTTAGGFGHLQKGHAIAFADIDNDGDQDVFAEMGGAFPGDTAINALFRNVGFDNHWLTVKLIGQRSNKSAIGARLRLVIDEAGGQREIYRWVSSGGSFGANPLRQEIGLGAATIVTTLEIHWPTTGQSQSFHDLPADQWLEIREGDSEYRVLNVR